MPGCCPPCPACRSATYARDLSAVFTSPELTYYICKACLHLWAEPKAPTAQASTPSTAVGVDKQNRGAA